MQTEARRGKKQRTLDARSDVVDDASGLGTVLVVNHLARRLGARVDKALAAVDSKHDINARTERRSRNNPDAPSLEMVGDGVDGDESRGDGCFPARRRRTTRRLCERKGVSSRVQGDKELRTHSAHPWPCRSSRRACQPCWRPRRPPCRCTPTPAASTDSPSRTRPSSSP